MPDVDTRLKKFLLPGLAFLALLFFAALQVRALPFSSLLQRAENANLDMMFKLRGGISPVPQICLVTIDDASLQRVGAWPWPRCTLARLLQKVQAAQPALVVCDFILPHKSDDHAGTIELARVLHEFRAQKNGGVILPYYFGSFGAPQDSSPALPAEIAASAFALFDHPEALRALPIPRARAIYHSAPELLQGSLPGGHINVFPDEITGEATVRWENHLIRFGESYLPSLPVQIALHAGRLTRAQVFVQAGEGIQIGGTFVPVDAAGRGLINYYGAPGAFAGVSAAQILQENAPHLLRNKIVFLGVTAAGTQDFLQTPVSARMPGVEKLATVTSNILQQNMLARTRRMLLGELLLLIAAAAAAIFIGAKLPRSRAGLLLAILALALWGLSFITFTLGRIWLHSVGLIWAALAMGGGTLFLRAKGFTRVSAAGFSGNLFAETGEKLPARLGRFEITGVLGEGAMGKIFAGFDATINRRVAIKTIRPLPGLSLAGNARMHRRFLHEAQAAGALHHPNIVTIFQADEAGPYSFLVMEFLEGKTLERIIEEEAPLPVSRTLEILLPICDALHYAHQRGVVHRDLKPANVMITDEGAVKLMDFGIAHIFSSTLTQEGALLGTPSYMSPEQMRGEQVDRRADIFALGVVAYEMATRRQPFLGDTMSAISHQIVAGSFIPPSGLNPRLPAQCDEIIQKALQKDKSARYQTAMDFAVALVQLVPVAVLE